MKELSKIQRMAENTKQQLRLNKDSGSIRHMSNTLQLRLQQLDDECARDEEGIRELEGQLGMLYKRRDELQTVIKENTKFARDYHKQIGPFARDYDKMAENLAHLVR